MRKGMGTRGKRIVNLERGNEWELRTQKRMGAQNVKKNWNLEG